MADRLEWQPIADISLPPPARYNKFIDIYAPSSAAPYIVPLEELDHRNYRILTLESKFCTFCNRVFENATALRKHLNEATAACRKAQDAVRGRGPKFVFFCWKRYEGSLDPATYPSSMHARYAGVRYLRGLEHPRKDEWLTKVLPKAAPSVGGRSGPRLAIPAPATGDIAENSGSDPSASSSGAPSPTRDSWQADGTSGRSDDASSGPRVRLPPLLDGFGHARTTRLLPVSERGQVTPMRENRSFFQHFLVVEHWETKAANRQHYNQPLNPREGEGALLSPPFPVHPPPPPPPVLPEEHTRMSEDARHHWRPSAPRAERLNMRGPVIVPLDARSRAPLLTPPVNQATTNSDHPLSSQLPPIGRVGRIEPAKTRLPGINELLNYRPPLDQSNPGEYRAQPSISFAPRPDGGSVAFHAAPQVAQPSRRELTDEVASRPRWGGASTGSVAHGRG